jgi:hypothetical protein
MVFCYVLDILYTSVLLSHHECTRARIYDIHYPITAFQERQYNSYNSQTPDVKII